jgi:hypothetical protein
MNTNYRALRAHALMGMGDNDLCLRKYLCFDDDVEIAAIYAEQDRRDLLTVPEQLQP